MTKKQTKIAKILFKKSQDSKGQINQHLVSRILKALEREKPQGTLGILKAYRRLIEAQLRREEVKVEMAPTAKSKKFEKLILAKTGARRVNFEVNPDIVVGAKITHGDWVWDETLDAKLARLTQND